MIKKESNLGQNSNEILRVKTPIDWEKIGLRFGIVVSFISIVSFFISAMSFLHELNGEYKKISSEQANKINELISKQSVLEGKLEILISSKKTR